MNEKIEFHNSNIDVKRKMIYKIAIGILVVIFFSGVAALSVLSENRKAKWIFQENISAQSYVSDSGNVEDISFDNPDVDSKIFERYPIYIVGAVKNQGIYYVENSIYLFELVDMAGGFTKEAANEHINLVYLISDSKTIRIPSFEDIVDNKKVDFTEGIIIKSNNLNSESNTSETKININTASKSLLETLPGIGPATAEQIISHREKFGNFKSIEEIMNVTGIKDNKFNLIKEKITITG